MTFKTSRAYYDFRRTVIHERRFIHGEEVLGFLGALANTGRDRQIEFPAGRVLCRAQLGHDWRSPNDDEDFQIPCAYPPSRMKPILQAPDGRVNPKGTACLYLATDRETAVAEARPGVGDRVSVGGFKLLKPVRLMDFSKSHRTGPIIYFAEPSEEKQIEAVWHDVDRAFSEPYSRDDSTADYVPTQIIAEYFKHQGFDGVAYKSRLGPGFNLALFDLNAADLIGCGLVEIKSVSYDFDDADNPYSVSK